MGVNYLHMYKLHQNISQSRLDPYHKMNAAISNPQTAEISDIFRKTSNFHSFEVDGRGSQAARNNFENLNSILCDFD